jgi:hypothetical protein
MYHEYYFELFSDIEKTEYGSKVAEWLWWLISDCKPNTTVFIPGYPKQMFRFPDLWKFICNTCTSECTFNI